MVEEPENTKRRGFGLWMLLSVALLMVVSGVVLTVLSGREVQVPDWLLARVEARLGKALAGGSADIGMASIVVDADWSPQIALHQVAIGDATGGELANLTDVIVKFSGEQLLSGKLRPTELQMRGVSFALRREPDGRFDLAFETGSGPLASSGSIADILNSIEGVFEAPALTEMQMISINDLSFEYEDVRAARYWVATEAHAAITRDDANIEMRVNYDLLYGGDAPAEGEMSITSALADSSASLSARVVGLPASDFSTQAPALAWLSVIKAPVTGAVRTELDETGALTSMNGALEIAQGVLQPTEDIKPVDFQSGRAYFNFDQEKQRITFDELSVVTEAVSLRAEGHGYLREVQNGLPQAFLGQFRFSDISANPDESFEEPVQFNGGALDFRLRLDPFEVTVGQFVLLDTESRIFGRGNVLAARDGWHARADVEVDLVAAERLRELWPATLVPKTRKWLVENVIGGDIHDTRLNIRVTPGAEPLVSLSFKFTDAVVRFLKTLPVAENGIGFASIIGKRFSLVVEQGLVVAPNGGVLDAAGTSLEIPDIAAKPARMEVDLRARGDIPAALSLLDEKPFQIMTRSGRPIDLAQGNVVASAKIGLDLIRRLKVDDVEYSVQAILRDVLSEKIVEGKTLLAETLTLRANSEGIDISGSASVGEVPVRAAWIQNFGPEHAGKSRVEGAVELSQVFLDEFGINLPDGAVDGVATGRLEIILERDTSPAFTLVSDLNRLGIRIADLGWAKPANQTGSLKVSGRLGRPVTIDSLELDAPGLTASGSIQLHDDSSLDQMRFDRVQVGGWLDAPIVLTGQGPGQGLAILIPGGKLDIGGRGFGGTGGSVTRGGAITTALDEVVVSSTIKLRDVRGDFTRNRGIRGRFSANLNGQAPIQGELIPQRHGTAVRVQSDNAGRVLGATGIIDQAKGGNLDLVLVPMESDGVYDGQLKITDRLEIHGAPALADLLGAISVIGLLEQLNGDGLVFGTLDARFRLTPEQVIVSSSSAVGPSLGISMNGYLNLGSKLLDMQGVISPIYLVNGIGALFTRKGEGLFGFNFRLTGPTDDPRTSVNPLSILTPGMFREIFRRPPPKLTE